MNWCFRKIKLNGEEPNNRTQEDMRWWAPPPKNHIEKVTRNKSSRSATHMLEKKIGVVLIQEIEKELPQGEKIFWTPSTKTKKN